MSVYRKFATVGSITENCRSIGLTAGDLVMVHASLRSVGPVIGGAGALADRILPAIGRFAEVFRTRSGVRCSNQVGSRMSACGAKAEQVLATTYALALRRSVGAYGK